MKVFDGLSKADVDNLKMVSEPKYSGRLDQKSSKDIPKQAAFQYTSRNWKTNNKMSTLGHLLAIQPPSKPKRPLKPLCNYSPNLSHKALKEVINFKMRMKNTDLPNFGGTTINHKQAFFRRK